MTPTVYKFTQIRTALLRKAARWVFTLCAGLGGLSQPSWAQTCSGVGVLTIDESFGRAGERPAIANHSSYRYVASSCPENGQFTVATAVNGACFTYAWHTVPEDHTPGDTNGNMLIINASREAGAFYQQPLASLCGGIRYEFSVWCLNLLRPTTCGNPTLPNLTIRIETEAGQVLQTIDFGTVDVTPTPTWRRYSTLFTAPAVAEPVVVKLINNREAGGCGNDMALDDIQLRPCESCQSQPAFVPDAFTPNGDGRNDVLEVFMRPAASFNLRVYNRWGSLLFSSDTPTNAWDGTFAGSPCPTGEYTYVLTYEAGSSTPAAGSDRPRPFVATGRVLLLR